MANKEKQAENKEKIGIGAWLALIVLILVLSGAFRTAEGPIKVLDFTNLAGSFGQIGDTGANLIGKGGTGAKDGFMAGFNLIPAVMFFCGLLGVFEQLGAFKASDILFRPLLRPLLGIPGKCGIAFISSFTGSDVAAVMTRELYEDGEITDDERTIFVAYQYAGSACINNTITGGARLTAVFGSLTVDLRDAVIAQDIQLETTAVFGSVHLLLPENTLVYTKGVSLFGRTHNLMPSSLPDNSPKIYLDATNVFGSTHVQP